MVDQFILLINVSATVYKVSSKDGNQSYESFSNLYLVVLVLSWYDDATHIYILSTASHASYKQLVISTCIYNLNIRISRHYLMIMSVKRILITRISQYNVRDDQNLTCFREPGNFKDATSQLFSN